jgi:hypothetical protein
MPLLKRRGNKFWGLIGESDNESAQLHSSDRDRELQFSRYEDRALKVLPQDKIALLHTPCTGELQMEWQSMKVSQIASDCWGDRKSRLLVNRESKLDGEGEALEEFAHSSIGVCESSRRKEKEITVTERKRNHCRHDQPL